MVVCRICPIFAVYISAIFALKWRLPEKADKTSYDQANEKAKETRKIFETIYSLCVVIHG